MALQLLKSLAKRLPPIRRFISERNALRAELWVEPGHYYSPIPPRSEILSRADEIFAPPTPTLAAIDLVPEHQLAVLSELLPFVADFATLLEPGSGTRYYQPNLMFPAGDAAILHCMMRRVRPTRVVEVGSGFSSAVLLDTNERYLNGEVELTLIEPYPDRLHSLLRKEDVNDVKLMVMDLQRVNLGLFANLTRNDILFIDSSHVLRTGSDVCRLFFDILPALKSGVLIHLHDIFYPFEYPREWVLGEGRAWNEIYALRTFLQYNTHFRIEYFADYVTKMHKDKQSAAFVGGGSFWLEKL